jgi:hypothetical protein
MVSVKSIVPTEAALYKAASGSFFPRFRALMNASAKEEQLNMKSIGSTATRSRLPPENVSPRGSTYNSLDIVAF